MQRQPIESINATLAALNRAWRVEPVPGINHAFALSACGPVHPEKLADLADDLGLSDLSELDDYLCPREPWHGLAGFALMGCDTDTRSEIEHTI